eukprot:GFUD01036276.1.p1 GENE.GFUD01036276.1~~GFUD01036276.1.p1  ORF type:complete len:266 (-),score=75.87 GFUD01036276.1:122-919(-)
MEGVKKLARRGSFIVEELFTNKSRQNGDEMEEDGDTDNPTTLPILRSFHSRGKGETKMEKEYEEGFTGSVIPSTGLLQYEDLLHHLTCPSCSQVVSPPVSQCRKGHLYCRDCRTNNKIVSCRICKQTFLDAPNLALEKILSLIALPCKFGTRGCPESVFLPSRLQHETVCQFRPVNCQFQHHGCEQVFSVKDMCWHHKMCRYAHYPHENVLPNMPKRIKTKSSPESVPQPMNGLSLLPSPPPCVTVTPPCVAPPSEMKLQHNTTL